MEDRVLLPLFLLSLAVMFFLLGDLSSFIVVVIAVLLVSLFCSLVRVKALSPALPFVIKDSVFVLSFSVLAAMVFAVVLPYLIFHNYFLNIYVIQYIYVFPVLFVFFLAVHWFNCFVKGEMPDYKHLIKLSFVIALVFSLILSVVMVGVSNYLYVHAAADYHENYVTALLEHNRKMQNLSSDLPVFNEIKAYADDAASNAKEQDMKFMDFSSSKGLCIKSNCAYAVANETYGLTVLVVRSMIAKGALQQANKELALINSGEVEHNYTSLDKYLTFLRGRVNSSNFGVTELDSATYPSDVTYNELQQFLYQPSSRQTGSVQFGLLQDPFEMDSVFYNSVFYAAEHSTLAKELYMLVIKVSYYTGEQRERFDLLTNLYENRDIKEPVKSKVIRYRIILTYAENKARQIA